MLLLLQWHARQHVSIHMLSLLVTHVSDPEICLDFMNFVPIYTPSSFFSNLPFTHELWQQFQNICGKFYGILHTKINTDTSTMLLDCFAWLFPRRSLKIYWRTERKSVIRTTKANWLCAVNRAPKKELLQTVEHWVLRHNN